MHGQDLKAENKSKQLIYCRVYAESTTRKQVAYKKNMVELMTSDHLGTLKTIEENISKAITHITRDIKVCFTRW